MSFRCFIWAWEQALPKDEHLIVLLALADIANDRGRLFASQGYLAKKCRKGERTVRRALEAMEGTLLTRTERPGHTDLIQLLIPAEFTVKFPTEDEFEAGVRGRPRKKTPATSALNPGHEEQKPLPLMADEPEEEPIIEPVSLAGAWVDQFQPWYDEYPKHKSRGQAEKAWIKVPEVLTARGQTISDLMDRTRKFADFVKLAGTPEKFIPHPATWLNAEGWNDELEWCNGPTNNGADRAQQRIATVILPMAAGAQAALDRRRGRWSFGAADSD